MRKLCFGLVVIAMVSLGGAGSGLAASIADFNLENFDFNITSYSWSTGEFVDSVASGTSNGVNWDFGPAGLWSGRTVTNGNFNFSSLPSTTDNLHPGNDFSITFDQTVGTLMVALSNDNWNDSINFGLIPTDFTGMTFAGTQAILNNASGGLALFENINSMTVHHTNNNDINDGFDLAFWVISTTEDIPDPVPEPATWLLLGTGLVGLALWRRRRES